MLKKQILFIWMLLLFSSLLFAQYTGGSGDGSTVWTSQNDSPLPVELLSYQSSVTEEGLLLEWKTASEICNVGFIVRRKQESCKKFELIDSYDTNPELRGLGTNSNGRSYQFIDKTVSDDKKYSYQISVKSFSGAEKILIQIDDLTYSKESSNLPLDFEIWQNYPNPFNPSTNIAFSLKSKRHVKVVIYSITGALLEVLTDKDYEVGNYILHFTARSNLSSNVYICHVKSGNIDRFMKMLYLK